MKFQFHNDRSIATQLTEIIKSVFPAISKTGLAKDLQKVYPDAKSKGKAVMFIWRKSTLRLTANLKVQELDFTNTLVESQLSKEAAEAIVKCLQLSTPQEQTVIQPLENGATI